MCEKEIISFLLRKHFKRTGATWMHKFSLALNHTKHINILLSTAVSSTSIFIYHCDILLIPNFLLNPSVLSSSILPFAAMATEEARSNAACKTEIYLLYSLHKIPEAAM